MSRLITLKNDIDINILNQIIDFKDPEKIYLHNDNIKINDYIYKNNVINNSISSISGIVIDEIKLKNKDYIVIQNDFKENSLIKNKKESINDINKLINLLDKHKLINILNKIKNIKSIKNLIVNSLDEEFYSAKEFIRLANNYREILETTDLLINVFNLNNSLLVVKNTNFKSIKNVKSISGTYHNIKINLVPDKYLIGESHFLCDYLNIKKEETLILSVNEIYDIYNIIKGKYITESIITISGNAIKKSIIINTKLYVSLKEILDRYIDILCDDYEIYVNGYLRGYKINIDDLTIIDKDIYCIVINKKEIKEELECINCGACKKICPYNINVKRCFIKKLSHKKCINCGLCNYICPSNIKLKEIVKSEKYEKDN